MSRKTDYTVLALTFIGALALAVTFSAVSVIVEARLLTRFVSGMVLGSLLYIIGKRVYERFGRFQKESGDTD